MNATATIAAEAAPAMTISPIARARRGFVVVGLIYAAAIVAGGLYAVSGDTGVTPTLCVALALACAGSLVVTRVVAVAERNASYV